MSDQTAAPKKRIEWIDALRGFTMILVVFSHVRLFTFEIPIHESFVNEVFISFRMPLFFFISGFIGYKANVEWNVRTWWTMSKKKMLIQLIPTLVFGLILTCLYRQVGFWTFATDISKLGYWFTLVLLEMFLIMYTMNFVLYWWDKKESRNYKLMALIILSCAFFLARFKYFSSLECVYNIFSFRLLFKYFPYFAFGYICSMYKDVFNKVLSHKYFAAVVFVLFVSLFYIRRTYIAVSIDGNFSFYFLDVVLELIVGFLGLLIVYNTFRTYSDSFSSDKKVGRALQNVGKRTLDIYLLHYFFLPYLPQIGDMLSKRGNNMALELALEG